MSVFIKKLYNASGLETGAVISTVFSGPIGLQQKIAVEQQLINYAFEKLYPSQGLSIYREAYPDTASIVVLKDVNSLPSQKITI